MAGHAGARAARGSHHDGRPGRRPTSPLCRPPWRRAGPPASASASSSTDAGQVDASKASGADAIEINTGPYADAAEPQAGATGAHPRGGRRAAAIGLEVLAGHGLNYVNVRPIVALPHIVELNIGHSIVARAALVGLDRAVREMVALLQA